MRQVCVNGIFAGPQAGIERPGARAPGPRRCQHDVEPGAALRRAELSPFGVGVRVGRRTPAGFILTPRVLELGVAYTISARVWETARVHLEELVLARRQASSIAELDSSDPICVARVETPQVVGVNIDMGTRDPTRSTALGKVLYSRAQLHAGLRMGGVTQAADRTLPARASSRSPGQRG